MVALWNRADHYIFALWCLLSFFSSPNLSRRRLDGCHTFTHGVCGLSANLRCRYETCCTWLAGNTGPKSRQKSTSGHHRATLSGYTFTTKAYIDNRKKIVKRQYVLQMFPQYGELRPTSGWDRFTRWGTPANFNGFRVLAALLHGSQVVGVSQANYCEASPPWTNRRSHLARAVHSHHPLPGRSHLQRMPQQRNDPFCCTMLLAIEWSLLQRTRYNALSMGKKTAKTAPSPWDFVTLPEEDRATAIGNMHKKFGKDRARASRDMLADRHTHTQRHTHHNTIKWVVCSYA